MNLRTSDLIQINLFNNNTDESKYNFKLFNLYLTHFKFIFK